jgi:flagellar biosynthesis protein FlhB
MADDKDTDQSQKTEDPTEKRLADARKKGQGASSKEVANWFVLMAGAAIIVGMSPGMMSDIAKTLRPFVESPHLMSTDEGGAAMGLGAVVTDVGAALAMPLGLLVVAALASGFIQRGFQISAHSMKPELEKISVLKGLKRMFSLKSVAEFIKGILKIVIVGGIGAAILVPALNDIEKTMSMSALQFLDYLRDLVGPLLIGVVAVMTVIAGLDYVYQRYEFLKQMKMSHQEIKDEMKQTDGDPAIKGRIRQLRQERARKRMIAAVPDADVVLTNPTHYSVALKYETGAMNAPRVVAKGSDKVALRIREVAVENEVPVIENPPLARALFAATEVDEEIPLEHYQAVAEIIGYVWRLKGKMGQNSGSAYAG